MHERAQRAMARLMFVVCCAAPTLVTLTCIFVTWTPWYHSRVLQAIKADIARDTGLIVEIDGFDRTAPSTIQLSGLRFLQAETQREVAKIRKLYWVTRDHEISVLLHQPELHSSELASAWKLIHDRFLCRPEHTELPIQVACNDLTVHSSSGSLTLRDVDAWIRPTVDGVRATVQCLPAMPTATVPIHIAVERQRDGKIPQTRWELNTAGTPLPCSALAEFLPLMQRLGHAATFSGTLRWQLEGDHWWIDLGGSRFEQVSLDRIFERQSHRLSGTASIGFERCHIEPHKRRSDVAGWVRSTDGMIGHSLLAAAQEHLGFQVQIPEGLADSRGDVAYDLLALGFNLHSTLLQLEGICSREVGYERFPPSVALCLDLHPLVRTPSHPLDAVKLASLIAPPHSVDVPLSRQTSLLFNVLIPPGRPQAKDPHFSPRIGRKRDWNQGPTISQPR